MYPKHREETARIQQRRAQWTFQHRLYRDEDQRKSAGQLILELDCREQLVSHVTMEETGVRPTKNDSRQLHRAPKGQIRATGPVLLHSSCRYDCYQRCRISDPADCAVYENYFGLLCREHAARVWT